MRAIKAFLVGATGLFIIITLFSLLIPSNVRVSRAVVINNATAAQVYGQVANFENWKKWHPVFTLDSTKSGVTGEELKDGSYRIVNHGMKVHLQMESADSASVKFLIQVEGDNDIDNDIVITPLPSQQAVQVEWRAITKLRWYPWEKFYGIFIDKLTGANYEMALNGLKSYLEFPQSTK